MISVSRYHFQDLLRKMVPFIAVAAIGSTFLYTYTYLLAQDVTGSATTPDASLGDVVSRFSSTSDVLPESQISFSGQNFQQLEWKNSLMFNQDKLDILYSAVNARPAPGTVVVAQPGELQQEDKVKVDEAGKVTFLDGKPFGTINEAGIILDAQGNAVGHVDTTGVIYNNNNEYLGKDPRKQPALAGAIIAPSYYLNSVLFYAPENWTLWMNYKRTRRGMKLEDLQVAHIDNDFVEFIWKPKDLDFLSPGWQGKLVAIDPKVVSTRLGKPLTQKELDAMATVPEASISLGFSETQTPAPAGATPIPNAAGTPAPLAVPGATTVPPTIAPGAAPLTAAPALNSAALPPTLAPSTPTPPAAAPLASANGASKTPSSAGGNTTPDALLSTLNPQAGEPSTATAGAIVTPPVASGELPPMLPAPSLSPPSAPTAATPSAASPTQIASTGTKPEIPLEMPALPGSAAGPGATDPNFSIQLELPALPKNIDIPLFSTKKLEQALMQEKQKRDELANIELEKQKEIEAALAEKKKAEEERRLRLKYANQDIDESPYVWGYKSKDGNVMVDRYKRAVKFRVGLNQTFVSNRMEVVEGYAAAVEITPPTETGRQGTQIPVQSIESEIFAPGTYPATTPTDLNAPAGATAPATPAGTTAPAPGLAPTAPVPTPSGQIIPGQPNLNNIDSLLTPGTVTTPMAPSTAPTAKPKH
ncbi:MAG: hypothetical protein EB060_08585 [Proteobacteria bacterium]|nr:hypothetical protein [Pseudomonadota bacterium]